VNAMLNRKQIVQFFAVFASILVLFFVWTKKSEKAHANTESSDVHSLEQCSVFGMDVPGTIAMQELLSDKQGTKKISVPFLLGVNPQQTLDFYSLLNDKELLVGIEKMSPPASIPKDEFLAKFANSITTATRLNCFPVKKRTVFFYSLEGCDACDLVMPRYRKQAQELGYDFKIVELLWPKKIP
jgi:hypothetical protein